MTPKQEKFCREYLITLNATDAAIKAGYAKNSAKVIGCENLTKPDIKAFLAKKSKKHEEKCDISREWVLNELKKVAGVDIKNYLDIDEGGGIQAKTWEEIGDKSPALQSIEEKRIIRQAQDTSGDILVDSTVKFKTHDKVKALHLLGKHLALFDDTLNVKMPEPILIKGADGKDLFQLGAQ